MCHSEFLSFQLSTLCQRARKLAARGGHICEYIIVFRQILTIPASVSNITHASDDAAKALCARLYVSIVHRPTYVLHRTECIWYTIGPQKSGPQVTYQKLVCRSVRPQQCGKKKKQLNCKLQKLRFLILNSWISANKPTFLPKKTYNLEQKKLQFVKFNL